MTVLLDVRRLTVDVGRSGTPLLDGISLRIEPGRVLGLVGESGSGKSTLARVILNLVLPTPAPWRSPA